jgi:hypothetical protein
MTVAGLRQANDIDLMVSKNLFAKLKQAGWRDKQKNDNDRPLVRDVLEAHWNWDFSSYSPTLEHLLASAIVVDGVPFASLDEVRKWKVASGRPKDQADIELINHHLSLNHET